MSSFCTAKECKSYSHFFSKNFQSICVSLDVNFNKSLTNDVVSFEQLGPVLQDKNETFSEQVHAVYGIKWDEK